MGQAAVIVADTGAMIALIDRKDPHHRALVAAYDAHATEWVLPWAVLPEIDYLLGAHVGAAAQDTFLADVSDAAYAVEWGSDEDMDEALRITRQYKALRLGLVDAVVMAVAARHRARAIATVDVRHFGAVKIPGTPQLWPRDFAG
jgi:predicted nucleic acid-binding protein